MLEAAAGLSYRGSAGAIEASKLSFRKGSPRGKLTLDDVLAELAVERFYYAFHYDSTKEASRVLRRLSKNKRVTPQEIVLRFSKSVYKMLTVDLTGYIVTPSRRISIMLFTHSPMECKSYTSLYLQDLEVVYA
jgi:hypothetical protein